MTNQYVWNSKTSQYEKIRTLKEGFVCGVEGCSNPTIGILPEELHEIIHRLYDKVNEVYYNIEGEHKENFCLYIERMIEEWNKK